MAQEDELLIPQTAAEDKKSFEILRVWIADKGQHVSLRTAVWEDPAYWGIMLADLAKHIANAYEQDAGLDPAETLQKIRFLMDAELDSPTDEADGSILQ